MPSTLFSRQFEYELWANQMTLDALRKTENADERALLLFSHLLSSHSMWLSRIYAEPMKCELFQVRTLEECEKLMRENTSLWLAYINTVTDEELQRIIRFVAPFDGKQRAMSVQDAMIHLINHSSYHRGQIIARLKGHIDPLPLTTYIAYASEVEEVTA